MLCSLVLKWYWVGVAKLSEGTRIWVIPGGMVRTRFEFPCLRIPASTLLHLPHVGQYYNHWLKITFIDTLTQGTGKIHALARLDVARSTLNL